MLGSRWMLEKSRDPRGVARFGSTIDQFPAGPARVVVGRVQPLAPARIVVELPPAGGRLIKLPLKVLACRLPQTAILLLQLPDLGPQRLRV